MKNQKGITLIALVITIIVLLILAGVTIAMLTGENGLITKSTAAAADTKVAEAKERATLEIAKQYADCVEAFYTDSTNVSGSPELTTTAVTGDGFTITANNTITITPKNSKNQTVTATVGTDGVIDWSDAATE